MDRHAWTDERIDDMVERVTQDIRELREDARELRRETRDLRKEMHAGFDRLHGQLNQMTIAFVCLQIATLVAVLVH